MNRDLPDRSFYQIGRAVPRAASRRLAQGRGRFTSDIVLPRMVHAAFVRSPHAHAELRHIDLGPARTMPGVAGVFDADTIASWCSPWIGTLTHMVGLKSAPQYPLARGRVRFQGEPIVMVLAASRAEAEDAAEQIMVDYEPLTPLVDALAALDADATPLHPELGDNLAFQRRIDAGDILSAMASADEIISLDFDFARHTGVTLEPRAVVADWNEGEQRLTVYAGTQVPHMLQDIYARHFGLAARQVRVLAPDVGGSFGIKIHIYPDEMAAIAASRALRRPVRFVADRLESFTADIHARGHQVRARIGVTRAGTITGFDIDDLTGIGPYSAYPRTSAVEANQVINLIGGPYAVANYRARTRVVFQTKAMMSQYRAVGHPIATAVTEALVDAAARRIDLDPVELRRRNLIPDDAYPMTSPTGMRFEALSHHACLEKLSAMMGYDALRTEQAHLLARGVRRGIGIASFIEITNPGAAFYGVGGAHISAQEGATIRLDAGGHIVVQAGVTDQGQGTETILAQIAAEALGLAPDHVMVKLGDTDATPYGGGTWASRGAGVGGEAVWQAARALRGQLLTLAASLLQVDPAALDLRDGAIVDVVGTPRMSMDELARIAHFRPDTLPPDVVSELSATRHYVPREYPFAFTNGVQASLVEVDFETGFVKLLRHWVVEDCGTIINPLLVDEQIRGGVVQGLGAALFEACRYDENGQMTNATMADYLVPMAAEMPDIEIGHVCTPTTETALGAKGAGEAGTAAAAAAVLNAVNDALGPDSGPLTALPITPARVLQALGAVIA
ncbi:xanthine dehydrogenase family protein molybdopterin-binding subunit [Acidiphilium sp.]|uniref:xanthine dehydrogenase family protein molybdopterin-binding subunit n=1 Tax=Acidiphilium sp. TaxID=527 RepID=UPI003CFD944F